MPSYLLSQHLLLLLYAYKHLYNPLYNPLTKKPPSKYAKWLIISVAPFGFEPKTGCLEGSCSIQLSYGVKNK